MLRVLSSVKLCIKNRLKSSVYFAPDMVTGLYIIVVKIAITNTGITREAGITDTI